MDYFLENWGSFVGALGVIVSAVGLWYAFKAHRAARSAAQAAREARNSVSRTLCLVSAQRALAVIGRLNALQPRRELARRALSFTGSFARCSTT